MASAYSWIQTSAKGSPTMAATRAADATASATQPRWAPSATKTSFAEESMTCLARRRHRGAGVVGAGEQPVAAANVHALQFTSRAWWTCALPARVGRSAPGDQPRGGVDGMGQGRGTGKGTDPSEHVRRALGRGGYARLAFGKLPGTNFDALYTPRVTTPCSAICSTEGAVRKEAVKHGKHVWLTPAGTTWARGTPWRWPSWEG